ncbi:hypothetical protein IQ241_10560 [Romeria aff. gracilis LEGE 07310]|uniref:Uncharacterized protein n=1 Tax=Vasconcelosia minhoensis LEGE 07310 TaxID=915328 RepID=A0A8J7AVI2_9CYAN|nr:hypothetical protein [Romeria gracilis]MBE9077733.1 hypothetical protein [Romeria aff. gracilis LEGE 07310]
MHLQFVTIEVSLGPVAATLSQAIEAALRQRGEPLRWAVTAVDPGRQVARVEAVVTTDS